MYVNTGRGSESQPSIIFTSNHSKRIYLFTIQETTRFQRQNQFIRFEGE